MCVHICVHKTEHSLKFRRASLVSINRFLVPKYSSLFFSSIPNDQKKKKKKKKRDEANVKNAKKKRNSSVRYASLTYRCKLRYSTEIIFYRFGVHRFAGYIRSQTEMRKTQLYHTYLRGTSTIHLQRKKVDKTGIGLLHAFIMEYQRTCNVRAGVTTIRGKKGRRK